MIQVDKKPPTRDGAAVRPGTVALALPEKWTVASLMTWSLKKRLPSRHFIQCGYKWVKLFLKYRGLGAAIHSSVTSLQLYTSDAAASRRTVAEGSHGGRSRTARFEFSSNLENKNFRAQAVGSQSPLCQIPLSSSRLHHLLWGVVEYLRFPSPPPHEKHVCNEPLV